MLCKACRIFEVDGESLQKNKKNKKKWSEVIKSNLKERKMSKDPAQDKNA